LKHEHFSDLAFCQAQSANLFPDNGSCRASNSLEKTDSKPCEFQRFLHHAPFFMIEVYAPGRAELLGNHTDYNEGYVLAIAVDRGTTVQGEPRKDSRIRIKSETLGASYDTDLAGLKPSISDPWSNYIVGVVAQFKKHHLPIGGFDIVVSSNLPIGAGLSSSASLEVATALFLQTAFNLDVPPLETAKMAQAAEHEYAGVKCGLLDQIAALYGRENAVTFIDCRTYEVRNITVPHGGAFVIANSGAKHALVTGEYNERRASCEAAAHALGVPFLRDIDPAALESHKHKLTPQQLRRARHVVGENHRVQQGIEALRKGDSRQFGELMFESHESSRIHFENSCPELDALVEKARKIPGIWGARLSGGGFGGATINWVDAAHAQEIVSSLGKECLITSAAKGAEVR
jgi:galactokinase